jgi:hypothetical protein
MIFIVMLAIFSMFFNVTDVNNMINANKNDSVVTIFDFTEINQIKDWYSVNDNVMGGVSKGKAVISNDSMLIFGGYLSLENNGGFASIRTLPSEFNLNSFEKVRIKVNGDGRKYQFRIRTDNNIDGLAYMLEFETVKDEWVEIDLPFSLFKPTYRGRILKDIPDLDSKEIRQIGFLLADNNEGEFKLLIDEIIALK